MSGRFSVPDEERVSERKARIYSALNKSAVSGTWILCSFSANFTPLCSVCRLGSFFLCSFNSVVIPLCGPALSTRNDIYIVPLKNSCVDYIQRLCTRIILWLRVYIMSPDPETRLVWIQSFRLLTFVTPSLIRFFCVEPEKKNCTK